MRPLRFRHLVTLSFLLLLLLSSQGSVALADPGILYVAPGGNCGVVAPCYGAIQAAVDGAGSGDEIRVASGTYTGVSRRAGAEQLVYLGKTVVVRGGYSSADWTTSDPHANPTVLDAQRQGRVLTISGEIEPTIQGLRITGGDATGLGGYFGTDAGGGVYVISATVTLRENLIYANDAGSSGHGGGLFLANSDSTLWANDVYSNTAGEFGGGLFLSGGTPQLSGNVFSGNTAISYGGGLYLEWSEALLQGNTFSSNDAGQGGGAYLYYGSWADLEGNTFRANGARHGGGLLLYRSHSTLSGNTISGNTGAVEGGGLWLYQSDAELDSDVITGNSAYYGGGLYVMDSSPSLTNVALIDNQGTQNESRGIGLYADYASLQLLHTTIARNTGGDGSGLYLTGDGSGLDSSVALTNTIVSGHNRGIVVDQGSTATLNATLWYANSVDRAGAGTITRSSDLFGDPAFAADGYHLTARSTAIDAGVDGGMTSDVDGQMRPQGSGFDLGADEYAVFVTHMPVVLKHR